MNNNMWILAEVGPNAPAGIESKPLDQTDTTTTTTTKTADVNQPNGTPPPPPKSPLLQFLPLILIFAIMYLFMFRGPRKQQQEHKKMLQKLSKNDRVRTVGGIIGTIVDIKDDEVVLKVDEANNTKIRVVASAIGKNLSQEK